MEMNEIQEEMRKDREKAVNEGVKPAGKTAEKVVLVDASTVGTKEIIDRIDVISALVAGGMEEKSAKGQSTKIMAKREAIPKTELVERYANSKSEYREGILKFLGVDVLALAQGKEVIINNDKVLKTIEKIVLDDDLTTKYCYSNGRELDLKGLDDKAAVTKILVSEGKSEKMATSIANRYKGGDGSKYTITILSGGVVMPILCKDVKTNA